MEPLDNARAQEAVYDAGWRVVAGAIRARFTTGTFVRGVQLVERLTAASEVQQHHPDITLRYTHVDVALNLADTDRYWDELGEILAPEGHVGLIVEPKDALRIGDPYKAKCIGIHWEFMFARARFLTPDMARQGEILDRVAALVDAGELRTTLTETLFPIDATNLRTAHAQLESGRTIGKVALSGWSASMSGDRTG